MRALRSDAAYGCLMDVEYPGFGTVTINGERFDHDVVVEAGRVRKRKKGPSKAVRGEYGHTPLTAREDIPWGPDSLVVGTGASGRLPIVPDLVEVCAQRGVRLVAVPTAEACELLASVPDESVFAILHVTC